VGRDGWPMLLSDAVLPTSTHSHVHDTVLKPMYTSFYRQRKEEMAAVTRRVVDMSPSSAAQTARAQSQRIKQSSVSP